MKPTTKILARSGRAPLVVTPEKWDTVDTSVTALGTELDPIAQAITEAERRNLLRVGPQKETFTRDCLALVEAHPELAPAFLGTADAARDWATRDELLARRWAISAILRRIDDTLAGLESDCFATALAAYQAMVRGGAPAGLEPEVAQLRQHFARYMGKKAAPDAASTTPNAGAAGATGNVVTIPGTPSGGTSPTSLAA